MSVHHSRIRQPVRGILLIGGVLFLMGPAAELFAADPLPVGCRAHIRSTSQGRIDWANGVIIAEGSSNARGHGNSDRFMAARGAEVVAARNMLATALGLRIDANGRFADLRDGRVLLEGVLRGHRVVDTEWQPQHDPPTCTVRLEAPVWGASGMASVVYRDRHVRAHGTTTTRVTLNVESSSYEDAVLFIDARGLQIAP